ACLRGSRPPEPEEAAPGVPPGRAERHRGLRNGKYDETRDWFLQNVRLMLALTEKGYELNYQWGIGGHNQKHAGAVFPDMMRWLWRDHPVSTDVHDGVERSLNRPGVKSGAAAPR
ncbi:MAG: hypothetical protein H0U94_13215, partial [Acidobacteria bacterium]|nr:hypothetical protein [Acidobacteriota bacterium]